MGEGEFFGDRRVEIEDIDWMFELGFRLVVWFMFWVYFIVCFYGLVLVYS